MIKANKTIICDTRQQDGKHDAKHAELERMGYSLFRSKVPWGDYVLAPTISVDTKRDIYELAQNIDNNKAHAEIKAAQENAKAAGCKLYYLVINNEGIKSLDDLAKWEEPTGHYQMRRRISGNANARRISGLRLAKACATMERTRGCKYLFCGSEQESARIIATLLEGGDWE